MVKEQLPMAIGPVGCLYFSLRHELSAGRTRVLERKLRITVG
jgi:hypothetical protein